MAARAGRRRSATLTSPYSGTVVGSVELSGPPDVDAAVAGARAAFPAWRAMPIKERTRPLFRFRELLAARTDELANLAALEAGKTRAEAARRPGQGASRWSSSPCPCRTWTTAALLEVSRGVSCEVRREPLGVVAGITPFNFPAMVPLWMFPIAITVGNAFILKPSEKVPLTATRLGELMMEAGFPPGVFSMVQGDKEAALALAEHPDVARGGLRGLDRRRPRRLRAGHRRGQAGAVPGRRQEPPHRRARRRRRRSPCAGSSIRSPAAPASAAWPRACWWRWARSTHLVGQIADEAARVRAGRRAWAPSSTPAARDRLRAAIDRAESEGAKVVVDGRRPRRRRPATRGAAGSAPPSSTSARPDMDCARTELFGPVLTVLRVPTLDEALALEAASPYGNATSVFTTSGAVARYVAERASSGMVGVNVGVPVPREPFSFGGSKDSKFGHGDITGRPAVEFWSRLKKITTKWALAPDANWMS